MLRYIDADVAISRINKICPVNRSQSDYKKGIDDGLRMAKVSIIWQPTADVVERKRGKWIRESLVTDYPYKCSACKKYSRARYDFCPSCGADMRGNEDVN